MDKQLLFVRDFTICMQMTEIQALESRCLISEENPKQTKKHPGIVFFRFRGKRAKMCQSFFFLFLGESAQSSSALDSQHLA